MEPYFKSFSEFLAMGGHGFYIWLCYGIVSAALILLYIYNRNAEKRAKIELSAYYRRQERLEAGSDKPKARAKIDFTAQDAQEVK